MRIHKTPPVLKSLYPDAIWHGNRKQKKLFLTFDDGPVPGVTDHILDILKEFNVRATFFCVGENILKHKKLFQRLLDDKHTVGNHTQNHISAWKHQVREVVNNIDQCENTWKTLGYDPGIKLYRPPFGQLKKGLIRHLIHNYKIIMWDVLPYDFSPKITPETCLAASIRNTEEGTIIVFHDSEKTKDRVSFIVYQYIKHFMNMNYEFVTIDDLFLQDR